MIEDNLNKYEKTIVSYQLKFRHKVLIISNILKSLLGIGILVIPRVVYDFGWIFGLLVIIFTYLIFFYGIILLFDVWDKINFNGKRFDSLIELILGKRSKTLINIVIIYTKICFSIANCITTSKFLNFIVCLKNNNLCNNFNYLYFYLFIISIPIIFIKKIKYFSYISLFSMTFMLITLFMIIFTNFLYIFENKQVLVKMSYYLFEFRYLTFPKLFGVTLFAFEGIGVILPLRYSIKPYYDKFENYYLSVCHFFLFILIILIITSYYKFGDNLKDLIFYNYNNNIFMLTLTIFYIISVFISFPLNLFPIYDILKSINILKEKFKNNIFYFGIRFMLLIIIYSVVLFSLNFINFLGLVGSFVTFILGILIPVILYNKVFYNEKGGRIVFNYLYLIICIILCLITQIDSINSLFISNKK